MVSNSIQPILGIDVSKLTIDVALMVGDKLRPRKFDNNAAGFAHLQLWLEKNGGTGAHVCMEATGRYYEALAESLYSNSYTVSVVNPIRIKGYAKVELKRHKTDELDASLIARYCATQNPDLWKPMPTEIREVQEAERYLDALKEMKQQESNRLESLLVSRAVKETIQKHIEQINADIAELEKWLKDHVQSHERLAEHYRLITSIIGIGNVTAITWLGEIGYGDRFALSRQVESFTGLTTKKTQSGTSIHGRERLSKVGNRYLRKALYMPAMVAINHNPLIKSFAQRLRERGKPPMVIIGAVMRKLVRLIFAVVKSGKPFDSQYRSEFAYPKVIPV